MERNILNTDKKRKSTEDQVDLDHPTKQQHLIGEVSVELSLKPPNDLISESIKQPNVPIPESNLSNMGIPELNQPNIVFPDSNLPNMGIQELYQPNIVIPESNQLNDEGTIEPSPPPNSEGTIAPSPPPNSEGTIEPSPPARPQRARRNTITTRPRGQRVVKGETIEPPYPWATDRRAKVHTLQYLLQDGITIIPGKLQCKKCEKIFDVEYDLRSKFRDIADFILNNQDSWHDRAPGEWVDPKTYLPKCDACKEFCKPILAEKKRFIDWLFLFLGGFIGCCTLDQIKYFCKHANVHRTGAKNRVVVSAYFAMCKQLDPNGPFHYQSI